MTKSPDERRSEEEEQRKQQERQHEEQERSGIRPSPPPYEVPETPLERLGPGLGYLFGVVGGAFLLNLAILALMAGSNGG
jgi:hypothetical protein